MIWFTSEGLVKLVPTPVTVVPLRAMLIVPTPTPAVVLNANAIYILAVNVVLFELEVMVIVLSLVVFTQLIAPDSTVM
jgi:hypothetical protein